MEAIVYLFVVAKIRKFLEGKSLCGPGIASPVQSPKPLSFRKIIEKKNFPFLNDRMLVGCELTGSHFVVLAKLILPIIFHGDKHDSVKRELYEKKIFFAKMKTFQLRSPETYVFCKQVTLLKFGQLMNEKRRAVIESFPFVESVLISTKHEMLINLVWN